MIPGLNATPRVFEPHLELLWLHGPVTLASQRDASTIRELAGAILADAPPRFALGGFSMGGYIAFEIMRQAPERVVKLALIDTSARPDTAEAIENRRRGIELARGGKLAAAAASTYPNAVHPANIENAAIRQLHLDMALANGPDAYVRQQQAIIGRPDSRPDLPRIKVPTAVIVGDSDRITPPEVAREMADGIAGAVLSVIPGAGHMALVEQPERVREALGAWLER
ncbi:MAG TPA: alpha/beta fold hydrolase [Alphaproteobacteria bacterium]|nr:alpha/beta fold hydrolase [Alphaproteobacteria bacterium]